jgi:Sap, sulfolipid-1-addressing protein
VPVGDAVADVAGPALAIGLSPVPILAVLVVLTAGGPRRNAALLLAGWATALAVLGTVLTLLLEDAADTDTTGTAVARIVVGAALLVVALLQWRRGIDQAEETAWVARIARLRGREALAAGTLLVVTNVKNVPLLVLAAGALAAGDHDGAATAFALAVLVLVGSAGMAAPVLVAEVAGKRATPVLARWRGRLERHARAVIVVVFALVGLALVADGVLSL